MRDIFENVHTLLRERKLKRALNLMLNKNTNRIIAPYTEDINHAWFLIGDVYFKLGRMDEALAAFKKAYRHWKEDIDAMMLIGNCYDELGNPKTAKYYYIKAISTIGRKRHKRLDGLTYNLGNAYFDMGKYELAITQYKKVRKSNKEVYQLAQKTINLSQKRLKTNL